MLAGRRPLLGQVFPFLQSLLPPFEFLRFHPKVAILGGGIAGMTAAHELAKRGFNVVVYGMTQVRLCVPFRRGNRPESLPVPSGP